MKKLLFLLFLISSSFSVQCMQNSEIEIRDEYKFACDECPFISNTTEEMQNHYCPGFRGQIEDFKDDKSHSYSSGKKKLRSLKHGCDYCSYSTDNISNFKRHIKIHKPGIKSFKCEKCPKSFSEKHQLKEHMRIHLGLKYICLFCGKKTTHISNHNRHLKNCQKN